MSTLEDISSTVERVADRAAPAVVTIGRNRRGAGVVVDEGVVLTNAHNVRGATVTVGFADGRRAEGEVRGVDVDGDLAVVQVDTGEVTAPGWASGAPGLGDVVLALAPTSAGSVRVTVGTVSGTEQAFRGPRGRRIRGGVEHTAPLARGSSGGPITDAEGRVVGINTHRLDPGFYLAQPVDESLRGKVEQLRAGNAPTRRRLGLAVAPPDVASRLRRAVGLEDRTGILVRGVDDESPAAAAGVREGDLVVRASDQAVESIDDLHDAIDAAGEGALTLGIVRGADDVEVRIEP